MAGSRVHLEDVARAARRGLALALGLSLIALAAMLVAGLAPLLAAAAAFALLALGCASGGFGLVTWLTMRASRRNRSARGAGGGVAPLRLPQAR